MKRFVIAIALACIIPVSALAGDMPTGDYNSPAPPQSAQETYLIAPYDVLAGATSEVPRDISMSILQIILGLAG